MERIINILIKILGKDFSVISMSKKSIDFTYNKKVFNVSCRYLSVFEVPCSNNFVKTPISEYIENEIKYYIRNEFDSDCTEVWKDIKGYEGFYIASNKGNIKSLNYGNTGVCKNLVFSTDRYGYKTVILYKNKEKRTYRVHRIIAEAFVPNPNNFPIINHKNEIKSDNRAENLEWCDARYNINYSRHGEKYSGTRPKRIYQKDKNGNVIKEWESICEAARVLGLCKSSISNCCRGKIDSYKSYIWEFI